MIDWTSLQGAQLMFVRIVAACLCGGAIGLERTLRQKDAGVRTHVIVAIGAALMMIISKYGFFDVLAYDRVSLDGSRVASNIITGISFLGAGIIFLRGSSIRGLTTAAGIWVTAAVGMAIGAGLYYIGVATTVLVVLVQLILHWVLIGYDKVAAEPCQQITIRLKNDPTVLADFRARLEQNGLEIAASLIDLSQEETVTLGLTLSGESCMDFAQLAVLTGSFTKPEEK